MLNPWIEHVKQYAKEHNISYGCAISEAKKTYVRTAVPKKSKAKPKVEPPEVEEKAIIPIAETQEVKIERPDYTDLIVDNWLEPNIGQYIKEFNPELYKHFDNFIIDAVSDGVKRTMDWAFLPLTYEYNDKVLLKYTPDQWIQGFHSILNYINNGLLDIVDTWNTKDFRVPDEAIDKEYWRKQYGLTE